MKKLYLVRHADAEAATEQDIDRQLSDAGRKEATVLAETVSNKKVSCDVVFCSSAIRARQTCKEIMSSINAETTVQYLDELYYIDLKKAMEFLKGLDDSYESVVIVSHNPTMSDLAITLVGSDVHFTTGIIKYLELDITSWKDATSSCGKLVWSLPN